MATQQGTVDFILDQMSGAGVVTAKKIFGEYGIYCEGKLFALVCDEQLFIKPTPAGRAYAHDINEAQPYPGAKPCLLVSGDKWEDTDWLAGLVRVTIATLPAPHPKKREPS